MLKDSIDAACGNCDGRKCMGCVMREYDHDCQDDCPFCCQGENERREAMARQDAVQALLGVLNDIGGGNPWNYNVMTEAAEMAWDAAAAAYAKEQT